MQVISVLVIICNLNVIAYATNILGFFSTPSRSHFIVHQALMIGLAEKGHNVTVVSAFPASNKTLTMPNYHHIYLDINDGDELHVLLSEKLKKRTKADDYFILNIPKVVSLVGKRSSDAIQHNVTQNLMHSGQKFDLVVIGWFFNDFQLGLAGHFQCPSVVISSVPAIKPLRDLVGNPSDITNVPMIGGNPTPGPVSFFRRVQFFIGYVIEYILGTIINLAIFVPYYEVNFPPAKNYPTFEEVKQNVSLVLINNHFSEGSVRAYVPNLVEIGGIHIKQKPDPLPMNIASFLDGAEEHGAILFTLGSNVKSSDITPDKLKAILQVFSKLKQKIIWKWEADILPVGKTPNILLLKWLPQDDILAHPNVRFFISHCGSGGIMEAKFHGKPILGIPVFGDQMENSKVIVNEGWAVELLYDSITEQSFSAAINELLTNPVYTEKIRKISLLYRDRPQNALDLAVFWVEYVLRHSGAKHMQSPGVYLNILQRNSIDVLVFLVLSVYASCKLMKWSLKRLRNYLKQKKLKTN